MAEQSIYTIRTKSLFQLCAMVTIGRLQQNLSRAEHKFRFMPMQKV